MEKKLNLWKHFSQVAYWHLWTWAAWPLQKEAKKKRYLTEVFSPSLSHSSTLAAGAFFQQHVLWSAQLQLAEASSIWSGGGVGVNASICRHNQLLKDGHASHITQRRHHGMLWCGWVSRVVTHLQTTLQHQAARNHICRSKHQKLHPHTTTKFTQSEIQVGTKLLFIYTPIHALSRIKHTHSSRVFAHAGRLI